VNVSPSDGGSVEVNQKAPASYPDIISFSSGDTVQVEAIAAPGYQFINWSGDIAGTVNPLAIKMDCNKKITANFAQISYTLTIKVSGKGTTTPQAGTHLYSNGETVTITATPENGWQFAGWSGDVSSPDSPTAEVVISTDKTITANFSDSKSNLWWIVGAIIAGILVIGFVIWLVGDHRQD